MESRESRAANITRVLFSIVIFFNLAGLINCMLIRLYVINPEYCRTLLVEDMAMELVKDHNMYMDRFIEDRRFIGMEFDEDQDREFVKKCFEEQFEVLENGDTTIGEWFDEMFEGVDRDSLRKSKDRLENDLDRYYDELEENQYFVIMDQAKSVTLVMSIAAVFNSAVMIAVTTVLHRNKWRVLRAVGISASAAGSVSLILWAVLRRILSSAILDSVDSEIEQTIYDSLMHSLMMLVMICMVITIAGAAAAITGGVNASAKARDMEDGYDGVYE